MAVMLLSALLFGCGPSMRPFASKNLSGAEGLKMAILPFDNLSATQGAGKTMENLMLVEFLKNSPARIIDPGEMTEALSQERVRLATSIPKETIKRLGKSLGANFFIIGIVHEYQMQMASGAGGAGQVPVLSITMRIIDAENGEIVWAINAARRGNDRETVFGIGRVESIDRLAEETSREVAEAFARSLGR
jgi:curli biogenesis system outer membrane secretion channel CsgG